MKTGEEGSSAQYNIGKQNHKIKLFFFRLTNYHYITE